MRTSRCLGVGLMLITVLVSLPAPSSAVPVFARKYGFSCTMCHSNFPRLNDFGARYRQNGYRLPGRENDEKTVLETPAPVAMRTSGGYTFESFSNTPDAEETSHFQMNGLDLLSAGLLGSKIGYMVIYTPQIAGSRHVEEQTGNLEMANVVFSDLGTPWLNLRAGRFEPAYTAFSVKRRLSIAPYDIYDYGAPGGVVLSETQTGIEITGHGPGLGRGFGFAYAAGCLNGSETNCNDDVPSDFYARATAVIGPGEGQTVGQRIGVMGYMGRARPDTSLWDDSHQPFYRLGVDASINVTMVNVALQYVFGKDNKRLWGSSEDVDFSGGFAELSLMPRTDFVAFGRVDMVITQYKKLSPPDDSPADPKEIDQDLMRFTGGARFYFTNNVALHLEYSRSKLDVKAGDDPAQDFVSARVDFAF